MSVTSSGKGREADHNSFTRVYVLSRCSGRFGKEGKLEKSEARRRIGF